jgi:cysteinyl-tRNA synthetase
MINKTFKQPLIDIHGGGFDLKFPHHENEMAQSRAYSGTNLANYWMHNGFINVNNEKMSKSLGNTLTATDFINKYGGNTLRLLLLSGHYRSPLNLTDEVISNNQKEVEKISNAIRQLAVYLQLNGGKLNKTAHINNEFLETLADDLNTANAISILFGVIKTINTKLRKPNKEIETLENLFVESNSMLDLLGLKINYPELDKNDIQLYTQYKEAKEKKDFAKSDEIRDKLIERGIL